MGENEKFRSILDLNENPDKDGGNTEFLYDLNLNQIIDKINLLWGEKVKSYFYFPQDADSERYRREIYCDFRYFHHNGSDDRLFFIFKEFILEMKDVLRFDSNRKEGLISLQNAVWNINEAASYCSLVRKLRDAVSPLVKEGKAKSYGMRLLADFLDEYTASLEFSELMKDSEGLQKELSSLKLELKYESNRIDVTRVTEEESSGENMEAILRRIWKDNPARLTTPFDDTVDLLMLEQEILSQIVKGEPKLFKQVEIFDRKHQDYLSPELIRMADELPFYLSFYRFENDMEKKGFYFSSPLTEEERPTGAEELYDLALACTRDSSAVVSNSFTYEAGEQFFVLTGPNQGGKTTFARSLGQLIYFTKMGLDVPAKSANVHYFNEILTHFSVEESVETGRGKLKEELIRLAPMMKKKQGNSFVIINELFTTAANYDAKIMGTNVLRHFISCGCTGIYVTHLKELCDADEHITGLSAMLDGNGRQNFRISRENIEYSDCAANQVAKHRLNYSQLVERLKITGV